MTNKLKFRAYYEVSRNGIDEFKDVREFIYYEELSREDLCHKVVKNYQDKRNLRLSGTYVFKIDDHIKMTNPIICCLDCKSINYQTLCTFEIYNN